MAFLRGTQLISSDGSVLRNNLSEILIAVPYTDNYISKEEIAKWVRSYVSVPIFKIELLNKDETPFEDISEYVIEDSINYSKEFKSGQVRSLSFDLINADGSYFPNHVGKIWYGTKIRISFGLLVEDSVIFFPRGVFAVKDASYKNGILSIQTADKFALIDGDISGTTDMIYKIKTQTSEAIPTIESLLALDDGTGSPYDTKRVFYPPECNGVTIPYTIEIDYENSIGNIIIEIAKILSCDVFYDDYGHLTLFPFNEITDLSLTEIDWFYVDGECQFFDFQMDIKFPDVYNKVMVVGANINGYLFDYTAENRNPASPTSIGNSPLKFMYIEDSNINSDELCKIRAEYELQLATLLSVPIGFSSIYIPFLEVNHLIECTNDTIKYGDGGKKVFDREKFLITSLSYSGNGGFSVFAKNIKELPFYG